MLRSVVLAMAALLLAQGAWAQSSAKMDLSGLSVRLLHKRQAAPGVVAFDLEASSTANGAVKGEVIQGSGAGPHPGVLFVHWLGEPRTTNHSEFEPDAIALARRGVTSVLVDTAWAAPGWFETVGKSADADLVQAHLQVGQLQDALSLLQGLPSVDPARIAYVGHDFGAMFGALLAGVDSRPRVFVLMAGVPTMSQWYLLGKTHPQRNAYVAALDALDIRGGLRASHAKAFLFQFAARDHYVKREDAAAFFEAAPLPRGLFTYDADHDLDVPQAHADRLAWLTEQLIAP